MTARRLITAPRPPRGNAKRPTGSQSLERGLDILEMIEAAGAELGVRELARRADLSPTIVQRLISSLALRGYLEKNSETSRYRLGHRSLSLGASSERAFDYAVTARRELEQLAREHHLNGFVSVLRGGRAIYVLAVQAEGPVAIKVSPGSEMPLHSTSAGKVLLAALSDGEARKLLGNRKLAAITPAHRHRPVGAARRVAQGAPPGLRHGQRGEHSRRAVARRADPRPRRCRRGGPERRLSQISQFRADAWRRRTAGDRGSPARLAHAWHAICNAVDWHSGELSGGTQ